MKIRIDDEEFECSVVCAEKGKYDRVQLQQLPEWLVDLLEGSTGYGLLEAEAYVDPVSNRQLLIVTSNDPDLDDTYGANVFTFSVTYTEDEIACFTKVLQSVKCVI